MRRGVKVFALLGVLATTSRAMATDFYVDPQSGNMANDGSAASPWKTLEEVVTSGAFGTTVNAGDRVLLRSGFHGELAVKVSFMARWRRRQYGSGGRI